MWSAQAPAIAPQKIWVPRWHAVGSSGWTQPASASPNDWAWFASGSSGRAATWPAIGILAVTKGFGAEVVEISMAAGLDDVGENYAQELLAKAEALPGLRPRWHFIGRLQRNKVRKLAPWVHLWQSVDRIPLGREIARHAPGAAVLVQVDVSGEPQKGGCSPDGRA